VRFAVVVPVVLALGEQFQVIRVHTQRISTLVVNVVLTRVNSRGELIEVAVCAILSLVALQSPVRSLAAGRAPDAHKPPGPGPAAILLDVNAISVF
jgi:hypothetical protein